MRLLAPDGVGLAPLVGRVHHPRHSLTLIAKITVKLRPGDTCLWERAAAPFPTGDMPYPDDEKGLSAPRYGSDFAFVKATADVMVVGHFHAPDGQRTRMGEVGVAVGKRKLRLAVVGRRLWNGLGPWPGVERAEPFDKLELRWEYAFGGPHCPGNPVGLGHSLGRPSATAQPLELPRIERPDGWFVAREDATVPGCFAPIPAQWPVRQALAGTYDARWQKTRWPWFAADCDPRYFQAALPELQLAGYLQGDESLAFSHMHATHAEYVTRLPGLHAIAAVQRTPEAGDRVDAVAMRLDTLWVDMDAEEACLVWRGVCEVRDPDASDIAYAWVDVGELAADLPAGVVATQALAGIATYEAQWEATPEAVPEEEEAPAAAPEAPEEPSLPPELAALLAGLPQPAPEVLPALTPEQQQQVEAARAQAEAQYAYLDEEPPSEPATAPWTRERVRERLAQGGELSGEDLTGIDLRGEDLSGAICLGTVFKQAQLDDTRWYGAQLAGTSFEAAVLAQADFSDASLNDADFNGSRAPNIRLDRAQLQRANLAGCHWSQAQFTGSVLDFVHAEAGVFDGACFTEASLVEADFSSAQLEDARFANVNAMGARFSEAKLTRVQFQDTQLAQADFASAQLDGAILERCDLTDTTLEAALAPRLQLLACQVKGLRAAEARLDIAQLSDLDGEHPIFGKAQLPGAQLLRCNMPGADFDAADLRGARLNGCTLRGAKFSKAELADAAILGCDCFEALFEGARMTPCEGTGSSFFRAEFLDADVSGFHGERMILFGSKLAEGKPPN